MKKTSLVKASLVSSIVIFLYKYFYKLVRGGIRANEFYCVNGSIDFVLLNTFKNAFGMSVETGLVYVTDRNVFFIMKTVYDRPLTSVTPLD